ncbi:MAG: hypothetical protein J7647_03225 [Cyanobacteria bacterium SBLK]|nr:hypothetical protein [Cyanobacteria bacterium SBLK]
MKNNCFLFALTLLTCVFAHPKVLADEVWTTEEYDNVVYQSDRNKTAIWSYGRDGLLFIEGLAGVSENRGSYRGYWVQGSSSVRCDTYREGANGQPSYHWGQLEITFLDPEFPSRWQIKIGLCDREPTIVLNGTPKTP